jgi:adenylosuccinate lyase
MDIKDNADVIQMREALDLLLVRLKSLIRVLVDKIKKYADMPCMGFTHFQPAEPTTVGYRLALYTQDLWEDFSMVQMVRRDLRGKGFKGAVGTGAAYAELIGVENLEAFEQQLSEVLRLPFYLITNQTYPRSQDYRIVSALAGVGMTLYRLSFDLRLLQAQPFGEVSEPFGEKQVGSSAMPFKRNPIRNESISSLTRILANMPGLAWQNAGNSLLERTLDESANRRSLLPEAFLICDEILIKMKKIIADLVFFHQAIERNLSAYGPFASTERLLMGLVKAGADRQKMHELIRGHAMSAWARIQEGLSNNLISLVTEDSVIRGYLSEDEIRQLMQIDGYLGDAPARALKLANKIIDKL